MVSNSLRRFFGFLRNHLVFLLPILLVGFLFGLLSILSHFPNFVEWFYAQQIYPRISKMLSPSSAAIPFSLSEITLYLGIFFFLFWGFRGVRRRRLGRTLLELLAGASCLIVWFYLAWGLNYFRPKIEQQLNLVEIQPDSLILRENFLWCIENANATWQPISPWNPMELNKEIERNYSAVFAELDLSFVPGQRSPKFLLLPELLDYTLTSGIFGPLFHEIHLNSHLLPMELPFVLAHEKAHALGFARESEASFLAVLVCFNSQDEALRYSAYFSLLDDFIIRYQVFADADSLKHLVRPEIVADFDSVQARIEKHKGPIAELARKIYDYYLRANQVEGGMRNYSDVVEMVMRWRATKVQKTN
jgi:hypothetical protein